MAGVYDRRGRTRDEWASGPGRGRAFAIAGMLSPMCDRDGHPMGHRCSCPRRVPVRGTVAVAR